MDGEHSKLLLTTGGRLAPQLAEYALTVAVRLDLELIVLFVAESTSSLDGENRRKRVELFEAEIEEVASEFSALAWKSGVKVTTIVDVNDRETAIDQVREQDPGIRFVLSDTSGERAITETDYQLPKLQVIRSG